MKSFVCALVFDHDRKSETGLTEALIRSSIHAGSYKTHYISHGDGPSISNIHYTCTNKKIRCTWTHIIAYPQKQMTDNNLKEN